MMIFGHSSKMIGFLFSPPPFLRLSLALDWNCLSPRTLSHIEHEKCLVRFTWSFYGFFGLFLCFAYCWPDSYLTHPYPWHVGVSFLIFFFCFPTFATARLTILPEGPLHCTALAGLISSCWFFPVGFLPIVFWYSLAGGGRCAVD